MNGRGWIILGVAMLVLTCVASIAAPIMRDTSEASGEGDIASGVTVLILVMLVLVFVAFVFGFVAWMEYKGVDEREAEMKKVRDGLWEVK